MKKTTAEIEIPKNATDPTFRTVLNEITKAITLARTQGKERITVRIEKGE